MVPDHWSNDAMVSMDRCGLVGTVRYKMVLGQYWVVLFQIWWYWIKMCWQWLVLGGTGLSWCNTVLFLVVVGQCGAKLFGIGDTWSV